MRHDEPMASPETKQVSAPSCVATPDALADRAGGDGCHHASPAPISATPAAAYRAGPLRTLGTSLMTPGKAAPRDTGRDRAWQAMEASLLSAQLVPLHRASEAEIATLTREAVHIRKWDGATSYSGPNYNWIVQVYDEPKRNPLTDPRAGDVIRLEDGSTLEALDVVLGHGAHVRVREDSSCYRIEHETWRSIAQGATVVHVAGG